MAENLRKVVKNAAVNSELENKKISDETIRMIEQCLKTENGSLMFQIYLKTTNNMENVVEEEVPNCKTSKYCYENGVLKNNKGIKNLALLHIVDSDSAAYYQSQIVGGYSDYKFGFGVENYLNLHKKLFCEVYPFAGEIRTELIYKSCRPYLDRTTPFCMPQFIYNNLKEVLSRMKKDIVNIKTREELVNYLGYYYGELNMIHPFREGNGRTLRTYFLLLVSECSKYFSFGEFELDYTNLLDTDKDELIKATIINSVTGDYDGIADFFDIVLVQSVRKVRTRSKF